MDKKANCLTTEMQFYQYIGPCGCAMRGRYFESDNRFEKHEGGTYQALEVRKDGKTNAVTTVTKDCMICEPVRLGHIGKSKGQANRIYSVHGKSVCLQAQAGGGGAKTGLYKVDLPDGDYLVRKLYPLEAERLQTLPDGYTEGISDTQRYKCIGNGWTVDVIAHIFSYLKGVIDVKDEKKEVEFKRYWVMGLVIGEGKPWTVHLNDCQLSLKEALEAVWRLHKNYGLAVAWVTGNEGEPLWIHSFYNLFGEMESREEKPKWLEMVDDE